VTTQVSRHERASDLLVANLGPLLDVGSRTAVTADATHLVSPDSRSSEPLPRRALI
jgi:hypothetical protein